MCGRRILKEDFQEFPNHPARDCFLHASMNFHFQTSFASLMAEATCMFTVNCSNVTHRYQAKVLSNPALKEVFTVYLRHAPFI